MIEELSASAARTIAIRSSGIGTFGRGGADDTLAALRHLGSVQIDTISVVERAHHHVLWIRNSGYRPEHLPALESEPRRILEYWSHAAAYIPIEGYRYCLPRMRRVRAQGHEWFRADLEAISFVRDRIRAEGPLRAQDFIEGAKGSRGWWDWKPAKIALEYLFHSGELVSLTRRGFQKVYELAERAIPGCVGLSVPSDKEMAAYYIDQAASSLGIFSEAEIAYLRKDGVEGISTELSARIEDGRLLEITIVDHPDTDRPSARKPYFALPGAIAGLSKEIGELEARIIALSPFDPLIIDRKRTRRLFDREYQLECYLPEAKRQFGYFALPLLLLGAAGDASIVGLLDAKADRPRSTLLARRLAVDPPVGCGGPAAFARTLASALWSYAKFNRLEKIQLGTVESSDGRVERSLRAAVRKMA